jgi:hypothetical protein
MVEQNTSNQCLLCGGDVEYTYEPHINPHKMIRRAECINCHCRRFHDCNKAGMSESERLRLTLNQHYDTKSVEVSMQRGGALFCTFCRMHVDKLTLKKGGGMCCTHCLTKGR